jgi:hypothetical protein
MKQEKTWRIDRLEIGWTDRNFRPTVRQKPSSPQTWETKKVIGLVYVSVFSAPGLPSAVTWGAAEKVNTADLKRPR